MKAETVKINSLISQQVCYTLPLFQRKYVWDKPQWEKLWEDMEFLQENPDAADHFLGSMVEMPILPPVRGLSLYTLIDGQQRLTTIFIMLIALRNQMEANNSPAAKEVHSWLINEHKKELHFYKLIPTEKDNDLLVFRKLVDKKHTEITENPAFGSSQILKGFLFFSKLFQKHSDKLEDYLNIICERLALVEISLEDKEDPNLVFESLNSTGRKLFASDLIRNYLFMKIPFAEQTTVYKSHWLPIEEKFSDEELTEFIRHYLKRDGSNVRMSNIYTELKTRVRNEVLPAMEQLGRFAGYYQRLLKPEFEPNARIRYYLNRLQELETTTVYPFLLNCYDMIAQKELSETQLVEILALLENYLIRRLVCERPSNILEKFLPSLSKQAKEHSNKNFVAAVAELLSKRDYPSDADFMEHLAQRPMYIKNRSTNKTKFLLVSIDEHLGKNEQTDYTKASIEHIMPQTLDKNGWWAAHLGVDYELIHQTQLHRLGNLTLTKDNSSLSNHSFEEKRTFLTQYSRMLLNNYFQKQTSWREEDIIKRGKHLAAKCLEIWPYFGDTEQSTIEVEFTIPNKLIIKNQVLWEGKHTWKDVFISVCQYIAQQNPLYLAELAEQYPNWISKNQQKADGSSFRSPRAISSGYYLETHGSADAIKKQCTKFLAFVGIKETDWQVERIAKS